LAKSILVSEETHRKLMIAKMGMGFKSTDDMLPKLASEGGDYSTRYPKTQVVGELLQ
jgi:hypothetical protein